MSGSGGSKWSVGDTTLRHNLLRNVVLLVVTSATMIGALLLLGGYQVIGETSQRAIEQTMDRMEADLQRFFEPVTSQARLVEGWGRQGELELSYDEVESLNLRLRPVVSEVDHISSVVLADTDGTSFYLGRDGQTWLNRFIDPEYAEGVARWIRWDSDGRELDRWEDEIDYRVRQRPWYEGAMGVGSGRVYWTDAYRLHTTGEPGVTTSRRFDNPATEEPMVVAMNVEVTEIAEMTTEMRPTPRGYNAIMTGTGELVGLPGLTRYEDPEVIRDDILTSWEELELKPLGRAWERWRSEGESEEILDERTEPIGRYFAGFDRFELGDRELVIASIVPRGDLVGTVDRNRNIAIVLGLLAIVLGVVLALRTSGQYRERIAEVYDAARDVGQYDIQHKLGMGGMGEVYRARHSTLKRPAAIKFLRPDLYDETSIKRFEREVRLTCRLRHPNTVTIFDYGRTDEGLFYYAMEMLEGVTLAEFLKVAGPLSEGRVIHLMRQICGALVEAHELDLVHRDIKPGNIMIDEAGGVADRITVLDFGLVKDIEAIDETQLTNQEYLKGSPGYVAPEVIDGMEADDPGIDIFSVGAVAYALICGKGPYDGESAMEVLMAQMERDPPPPSEVLDRKIDGDLEELIMECLKRDPDERPESMREVLRRLVDCESAYTWTMNDALDWWEDHGGELSVRTDAPETDHSPAAFGMTLTMSGEQRQATLTSAPEELVDD